MLPNLSSPLEASSALWLVFPSPSLLALLFLLSLSMFFFSSLVSLWILGTEHSWVLTLAKGDPLRKRSTLAHRTICLHCNIPPQNPIESLDWMKVLHGCTIPEVVPFWVFPWQIYHPIRRLSSAWECVTDLCSVFFAGLHIMVPYVPLFILIWCGINSLSKFWIDKLHSSLPYLREVNMKHPQFHLSVPQGGW